MKKFTGFMKYIISGTGVTFMVTTLFLWGAATLLSGADGMNDISFRSETFAAIFVFALLTALISLVLKAKFISPEIGRYKPGERRAGAYGGGGLLLYHSSGGHFCRARGEKKEVERKAEIGIALWR